ncbi:MAG: UDP-N-acetylmuramoyl-L-alanyl-D-glutamate--2,6-diaminopimelate ligase [Bacteroidales bacterium]|nr:UDP-N-acetylmuramoyl-L-alanyl-D-glutamate--2,6-diaminopimelate ligase [Bacteroidales bacterium]
MKKLNQILEKVKVLETQGDSHITIHAIQFDSRKLSQQDLFIATRGTQVDGHQYIDKAIELGANSIICEELPPQLKDHICYIKVANSQTTLGIIASAWFDNPSEKLKLVGVTGTNGKTTIATLLYELFNELGYFTGLISTIENKIGDQIISSTHTTPDAIAINQLMSNMVDAGCNYCFMEVSSHALDQGRTTGLDFDGAIFTNLTHDHLDYHKEFSSYLKAKKIFFDQLKRDAFAITNLDDKNGMVMLQNCQAKTYSYTIKSIGDFKARIIENLITGLYLNIDNKDVWFRLTGQFNAYNLLAIYGTAILLDQEPDEVLSKLSDIGSVNGRFDFQISEQGIIAIIDYAHTPDALLNVLKTVTDVQESGSKLITVVGAGGNRDKSKRPEMAKIAANYSDQVILTSDNPRFENPDSIIQEMKSGLSQTQTLSTLAITNREEAIKTAFVMAKPNDFILIAGKGHETYQNIQGVKHHFDDKEVINKLFNKQ